MSTKKPQPSEAQDKATEIGVPVELSKEAINNLTGFFDVLIQMDLAQKRNELRSKENGKPDNKGTDGTV